MEFNFTNWVDPNFYERKLPNSEQIDSFFDCISTDSPTRDNSFFYGVPSHNYTPEGGSYSRSEFFPIMEANTPTTNWISSFLNPIPFEELSISECSQYGSEIYKNKDKNSTMRTIPAIAFSLEPEVYDLIPRVSEKKCISKQITIKSLREMSSIASHMRHFIQSFLDYEIEEFKRILDLKGYIQTLSHTEITEKVLKLKKLFPDQPIYILADTPLLEYLLIHCKHLPGQLLKNTWLIQSGSRNYRYREHKFSDYKSAIFSTTQMKGANAFQVHYTKQRANRCWEIYFSVISRLGFNIPSDPIVDNSEEFHPILTHPRWTDLT